MGKQISPKLTWLKQHERLPVMRVSDLTRLMSEGFGLFSSLEPKGKNYFIRFSDRSMTLHAPHEDFQAILVPTHGKNGEYVSPLCILQLLAKFDLTREDFRKQYNRLLSQEGNASQEATGTEDDSP